ncbi:hypothetical protein Agabi119p4_2855 [Agaricus bisporus var. burnettii]|uniref:RING-type domain-containing protein n=1 Tax=Agaricus bisporus var. burnettii TaxID=192524 RepID=A0A8H7F639_AGABI|nr:hypothetical protein Agabi119p4_2855 [Agaricus bisporus var. burnettii]
MDELPFVHNSSFSLNLTQILDYLPNKFLARFLALRAKPTASPTTLDLDSLSPSTISDLMATPEWSTPLSLVSAPQASPKSKLLGTGERSLLFGPLGFFTSGYMLGLFLMAFILHRLHNTVIPSRLSRRHAARRGRLYSGRAIVFIRIYNSIFPIDLSRTHTRFLIQFPTLYCLLRMCLLWSLITLQTSGTFPESFPTWVPQQVATVVQKLGDWAFHKPMEEVCWISFCSLGLAYFVESFVRKLDELANGTVDDSPFARQMSPYNLVAHSFVLYLFSLDASHVYRPEGLPARPDTHALITMGIPLLQSTMVHFLCISKKLSNHRLIPTALTSFLGLLHFHTTLLRRGYLTILLPLLSTRGRNSDNIFSGTGFKSGYPLMNYFSCVVESVLICVILVTIILNALVQLLVNGRVDRLFTTLGIAAAGGLTDNPDSDVARFSWANLPFEEEWGVVLMRIGTASLEATGLKGWGNEVAPISAPILRRPVSQLMRRGQNTRLAFTPGPSTTFGAVTMGRSGVGRVFSGHKTPESGGGNRSGGQVQTVGWNNEVRSVESNPSGTSTRSGRRCWIWFRELVRFVKSMGGVFWGLVKLSWSWTRGWRSRKGFGGVERDGRLSRRERVVDFAQDVRLGSSATEMEKRRREREVYERFLRGEEISDDEDDAVIEDDGDYEDEDDASSAYEDDDLQEVSPSMRGERSTSVVPMDEQQEREAEAISLFADLVRTQGVDEGSRLVLSHLVNGSARTTGREPAPPLTRRRWGEMGRMWGLEITDNLDGGDDGQGVWDFAMSPASNGQDAESEVDVDLMNRTMCIICTSKPRDVVSWPCRCLVMCDQCREILAAKGSPSKHCCPCCRQPIDGYSRIFIP